MIEEHTLNTNPNQTSPEMQGRKGKIRQPVDSLLQETDSFLRRPTTHISNLNKNLKESYGKKHFKEARFQHLRLLKKYRSGKKQDSLKQSQNQDDDEEYVVRFNKASQRRGKKAEISIEDRDYVPRKRGKPKQLIGDKKKSYEGSGLKKKWRGNVEKNKKFQMSLQVPNRKSRRILADDDSLSGLTSSDQSNKEEIRDKSKITKRNNEDKMLAQIQREKISSGSEDESVSSESKEAQQQASPEVQRKVSQNSSESSISSSDKQNKNKPQKAVAVHYQNQVSKEVSNQVCIDEVKDDLQSEQDSENCGSGESESERQQVEDKSLNLSHAMKNIQAASKIREKEQNIKLKRFVKNPRARRPRKKQVEESEGQREPMEEQIQLEQLRKKRGRKSKDQHDRIEKLQKLINSKKKIKRKASEQKESEKQSPKRIEREQDAKYPEAKMEQIAKQNIKKGSIIAQVQIEEKKNYPISKRIQSQIQLYKKHQMAPTFNILSKKEEYRSNRDKNHEQQSLQLDQSEEKKVQIQNKQIEIKPMLKETCKVLRQKKVMVEPNTKIKVENPLLLLKKDQVLKIEETNKNINPSEKIDLSKIEKEVRTKINKEIKQKLSRQSKTVVQSVNFVSFFSQEERNLFKEWSKYNLSMSKQKSKAKAKSKTIVVSQEEEEQIPKYVSRFKRPQKVQIVRYKKVIDDSDERQKIGHSRRSRSSKKVMIPEPERLEVLQSEEDGSDMFCSLPQKRKRRKYADLHRYRHESEEQDDSEQPKSKTLSKVIQDNRAKLCQR